MAEPSLESTKAVPNRKLGCLGILGILASILGILAAFNWNIPGSIIFLGIGSVLQIVNARRRGQDVGELREQLGLSCLLLGILALFSRGPLPMLVFVAYGFILGGTKLFVDFGPKARARFTNINPDRWVDFFGSLIRGIGVIGMVAGAVLVLTPGRKAAPFVFLFALLANFVGQGIRRRELWAGALGLVVTFLIFFDFIQKSFIGCNGDWSLLPTGLFRNLLPLLLSWFFFLGFYSIFYPIISERAKQFTGVLEKKLEETGTALNQAKERLTRSEELQARTVRDLEDERLKFRALFETVNEGIALFDKDDRLLYLNPAFCSLFELKRDEFQSRNWKDIFSRGQVRFSMLAAPGAGTPGAEKAVTLREPRGEIVLLDPKSGQHKRRIEFYTNEIRNQTGEFLAFSNLSRDVTLEREIDRMKTEFVSNVSHELRTPLTSIRAYTEMLIDDESEDPKTTREYLDIILGESERLTNLINDILDLSKMEAGKKVYKFVDAPPAVIIRKVLAVCASEAQKKEQTLEGEIPSEELPARMDADLIHQALMNLVNNALKYTPQGGKIVVSLKYFPEAFEARVSDNGPGISREDQKKLFSKFFRVESTLNRDIGGTGLGLALVKQIVLVHQGTISVESDLGMGTTFIVRLPWNLKGEAPAGVPVPSPA